MLEVTQIYLEQQQKRTLKRLALQRSEQTGKSVSMADLVRESIDIFLASLPRDTEQSDMRDIANTQEQPSCK